ncbi:P-loop containing nucleoside triphosphate hydrolase protein [Bimuria novae-zelandiae CBS 107.79]|uniref:RNA helicase n=1 Tax=Bimuria novae-zelandiae CBS 107.79 TaxID=1447943 RepID=A0A6A5USA3_9PLEO|nr:P-loop containing nucleoside triphosphate hydrolase protein [Bimuria novae-zelandiae CBS 107.79]
MAPNKKKKKPQGNPARGFATTSVASKPKEEKPAVAKDESSPPEKQDEPVLESSLPVSTAPEPIPQTVEQTPEELEAQLERDELQLLVEKHAPKVRRESRRQVVKLQTDRRVLRAAAESLTTYDWLSNAMTDSIISLAQTESKDSNRKQGQQSLLKVLSEEDAMSKLWMLDLVLREMGFAPAHIEPVLRWLCANAIAVDSTASVWGLQEALEWLALDHCERYSLSYDEPKKSRAAAATPATSRPDSPVPETPRINACSSAFSGNELSQTATPRLRGGDVPPGTESEANDFAVSDLDSDLEPDQLVPTYIKIKGKLFEIDPEAAEPKPRKQGKGNKGRNAKPTGMPQSPAVRKLLSQLQKLEYDALFDEIEAGVQWPTKRAEIALKKAAQRQEKPVISDTSIASEGENGVPAPRKIPAWKKPDSEARSEEHGNEDEDVLLGDMFSAIPEEGPNGVGPSANDASVNVMLRDFGKQSGVSPRRVLEEAIRARDPAARISYKQISPTTYACRHSATIVWSKEQDLEYDKEIAGVIATTTGSRAIFEASTIATVSSEQSEGFVSTVALFSLFAASTKEEKVYLRLSPVWRDLYRELFDVRKSRIDSFDRDRVKYFRSIIQDQLDDEESEGVVLTGRFKARNQAATSSSPSTSGQNTPPRIFDSLKELWYNKASTNSFQYMLAGRATLPVYAFRQMILSTIDQHQVTIICGETGCGKSTQIPSFLLEHELSQGKPCKIFCTEPRRISAISLAQRLSEELGEGPKDLGTIRSLVGYAIRLESKTTPQTRLIFATVGVVLRMLEAANNLNEVTHLIIDEVHERSIDTDFLLIILRSLMITRPELKVVLMSATVDANRFSSYLNGAPVLTVPGRTFPVQTQYLEDAIELTHYTATANNKATNASDVSDNEDEQAPSDKTVIANKLSGYSAATRNVLAEYDEYAIDYELILRLMEVVAYDPQLARYSSAILCFMPGIAEIRQLNDLLIAHPSFDNSWLIYPLHSTISSEEQQAAFVIPPQGMRKIVIATNIAETGITIPDITCVIDTGKHKEMRFDERRQLSRLTQSFISRANAKQRRGRAGRVQEGLCFHLFTKYRHDNLMVDQQTPEMLRLSLQDLVMRTKICKLGDIEKTLSEALDPPSSRNIRRAIDALIEVDALTPNEDLTPLGSQIAKLPLDAHLGKLVLLSAMFSCTDAAITIAAILSSKSPFLTPFGAKQRADAARMAFKKGDSDLLTIYNAYNTWKNVCITAGRSEAQFCHKNFLSASNLSNIEDLKAQLLSSLVEAGFVSMSPEECRALSRYRSTTRQRTFVVVPTQYNAYSENDILVNSVVATAFYPKILTRDGKGWRNISNAQSVSLSPTSVNKASPVNPSTARYLSYYHIMQSSNKFYNAHSTSIVHPLPMVLMAAADVEFKLHAGMVAMPGNALRFTVKEWRAAVALKVLRRRVKEVLGQAWKNPGRGLSGREREWLGLLFRVFEERWEREERIRERGGAKGK